MKRIAKDKPFFCFYLVYEKGGRMNISYCSQCKFRLKKFLYSIYLWMVGYLWLMSVTSVLVLGVLQNSRTNQRTKFYTEISYDC